jgi:hypothetical protein
MNRTVNDERIHIELVYRFVLVNERRQTDRQTQREREREAKA